MNPYKGYGDHCSIVLSLPPLIPATAVAVVGDGGNFAIHHQLFVVASFGYLHLPPTAPLSPFLLPDVSIPVCCHSDAHQPDVMIPIRPQFQYQQGLAGEGNPGIPGPLVSLSPDTVVLREGPVVVVNDKVRSLNTLNRDVGSDDVNNGVETRKIISCIKPDLLSRLKSVAAGAA